MLRVILFLLLFVAVPYPSVAADTSLPVTWILWGEDQKGVEQQDSFHSCLDRYFVRKPGEEGRVDIDPGFVNYHYKLNALSKYEYLSVASFFYDAEYRDGRPSATMALYHFIFSDPKSIEKILRRHKELESGAVKPPPSKAPPRRYELYTKGRHLFILNYQINMESSRKDLIRYTRGVLELCLADLK